MSLLPPQGMPWGERLERGAIRVRVSASSALILRSPPSQFPLDNPADWQRQSPEHHYDRLRRCDTSHCGECS